MTYCTCVPRFEDDPASQRSREGESSGSRGSLLGRMLRLAAVLVVLALAAMVWIATDDDTIPFEYEGFD